MSCEIAASSVAVAAWDTHFEQTSRTDEQNDGRIVSPTAVLSLAPPASDHRAASRFPVSYVQTASLHALGTRRATIVNEVVNAKGKQRSEYDAEATRDHHPEWEPELWICRRSFSPASALTIPAKPARETPISAMASRIPLGIEIRAGVHTGECEIIAGKVGGLSVIIGARVKEQAGPGEVLVSNTVKDLVAGSGIAFADRGLCYLKGVPGEWRLYAVTKT